MKRTSLLIQERPLQYARKAYSRTLKGMFLNQEKHVGRLRGVKILTNSKRRKEREGWVGRLPRYRYKKEVSTPFQAAHSTVHSLPQQRPQLAPPPTPPPEGRGVITEIPLWRGCRLQYVPF